MDSSSKTTRVYISLYISLYIYIYIARDIDIQCLTSIACIGLDIGQSTAHFEHKLLVGPVCLNGNSREVVSVYMKHRIQKVRSHA